jgi:hypothetical protein
MKEPLKIPVFAINLSSNPKRRATIQEQFKKRDEFELNIFRGVKSKTGYLGFLKSIKKVIKLVIQSNYDFVIICSDDHVFTENYKKETFIKCIIDAGNAGAKILLGGIERYGEVIPLTDDLLWVDHFADSTFYVIYKTHFQELLQLNLNSDIPYAKIISSSTSNKFLIYPFVAKEGVSGKKERGIQECPREFSDNFRLESISRLEKIRYLKKYQEEKA